MMKKLLLTLPVALLLLLFPACETDVDINAEWEEITIVYGLLNQLDTTHYFRVNKAFLGGNALEIAKIPDSSSYKNNMDVRLEGWKNGNLMQTIIFDTTTIYDKDPGVFYYPEMVVYKGTGVLNESYEYRLFAKNKTTGHEVTAKTTLIHDFGINSPPGGGRVSFTPGYSTPFAWDKAMNARRYEPMLRIHYYELPIDTYDTIPKHIDWFLSTQVVDELSGGSEVEIFVGNDAFYQQFVNELDPDFVGDRLAGKIDFIVSAGGEEYDTYMRVNGPSYSLVQDRPEYTNIENGFGLLSSRYQVIRTKRLSPTAENEIIALNLGFIKNLEL